MRGGAGNDTYIVDNASDVVRENSNQGTDLVKSSSTYILRNNNVENLTLTGSSNINGTGNASSNIIIGNSGANKLIGGDGDDRLDGGGGDDVFRGGRGNDIYYVDGYEDVKEFANQGNDLVISTASFNLGGNIENLTLTGSSNINGTGNNSENTIRGNSGANTLIGFDGLDFLFGNAGNDILYGNAGNDRLNGGYGNDTLYGGIGNDRLIGFTGNNRLFGGNNNDTLMGGVGNDVLHGDAGNDGLFGGSGNDTLNGGNGNDTLSGDKGDDTLQGGEGNDIFWIASGIGRDLILDYENGVDRIELRNGLVENDLTFSHVGGHTRIQDDAGDLLAIIHNTIADDITFI
jgi:Ca2+-binding RTX toxin-like protein